MIQASKSWKGTELVLSLSGELDETAELGSLALSLTERLCFNTRGITRMNSVGVRAWTAMISSCMSAEANIRYEQCSPAFVNHLNMVLQAGGGTVDSVMGPFHCARCDQLFEVTIQTPNIESIREYIAGQECGSCGSIAEFDEVPSEYFSFLC